MIIYKNKRKTELANIIDYTENYLLVDKLISIGSRKLCLINKKYYYKLKLPFDSFIKNDFIHRKILKEWSIIQDENNIITLKCGRGMGMNCGKFENRLAYFNIDQTPNNILSYSWSYRFWHSKSDNKNYPNYSWIRIKGNKVENNPLEVCFILEELKKLVNLNSLDNNYMKPSELLIQQIEILNEYDNID